MIIVALIFCVSCVVHVVANRATGMSADNVKGGFNNVWKTSKIVVEVFPKEFRSAVGVLSGLCTELQGTSQKSLAYPRHTLGTM